jgi:MFS family permease
LSRRLLSPALLLVSATLFLGAQVPNLFVLAPRFLHTIGRDEAEIGVVMGAFNLASLASMPLVGWLTARVGHARLLAAGCLVCATGALVFDLGYTADPALAGFILGRALQGLGFACVLVGAGSYVAETAPVDRLAQALGIAGVLTLCAQAVGPAVGELACSLGGWHWLFRTAAICGLLGALPALLLPAIAASPPLPGAGGRSPWPILVATGLAGAGFGSVWSFLAAYTEEVGIAEVTSFFVPYVVAAISTRLFLGRLPDVVGRRQAATPALAAHGAVLVWMATLSSTRQLIAIGACFGLAHGVYYPTLQALVVERGRDRSRAIARSSFAFTVGQVSAAYGLGVVARATSYPVVYLVTGGASVIAAAIVWRRG